MSLENVLKQIKSSNWVHEIQPSVPESTPSPRLHPLIEEYLHAIDTVFGCNGFDLEITGNPIHFFGSGDLSLARDGYDESAWTDAHIIADEGGYPVLLAEDGSVRFAERVSANKKIVWKTRTLGRSIDEFYETLLDILKNVGNEATATISLTTEDKTAWESWLGLELASAASNSELEKL